MSAARARGRRGQGTIEFVLILPLLVLMLVAVADYAHVARETANVQAASSEGARYAAANPTLSNDAIAAYVREACALGDGATVTVTSAEAPSKPVTLKSGRQVGHRALCAREGHRQGRRGCRLHLPAQVARREGRHR